MDKMDEILMQALIITIDKIKEDNGSSNTVIMATLILSIFIKEVEKLLAKEENKNDNSSKN